MANTNQFISTKSDPDLLQRLIAAAEMKQIPDAAIWVQQNMALLISEDVQDGQTIADVYSYAKEVRDQHIATTPPAPGANLGAVTDAHMNTAIDAIYVPPTPPAE